MAENTEFLTRFNEDVAYIQQLGDNPNADNGLNADALKAWFDKAPEAIKSFLNQTFIPQIEAKFSSVDEWISKADGRIDAFIVGTGFLPLDGGFPMNGNLNMDGFGIKNVAMPKDDNDAVPKSYVMTMEMATVTLQPDKWINSNQTVAVAGVLMDTNKQAIISVAAAASLEIYLDCNIKLTGQGDGTLTFSSDEVPNEDIGVNILILTKGG